MIKTARVSYRYLSDDAKVYCVGRLPQKAQRSGDFVLYSAPFYSKERKETQNAIMAFKHDLAAKQARHLADKESLYDIFVIDIDSLKYYSHVLQMPLVVELDNICSLEDNSENIDVYCHFPVKKLNIHNE